MENKKIIYALYNKTKCQITELFLGSNIEDAKRAFGLEGSHLNFDYEIYVKEVEDTNYLRIPDDTDKWIQELENEINGSNKKSRIWTRKN